MNWQTIRLELARSAGFPEGSATRAYLLRLPLDEQGFVDGETLRRKPQQATVRRFWPSEPDQHGHVERADGGWIFRCQQGPSGEAITRFGSQALLPDEQVLLEEPDGTRLTFRVASIGTVGPSRRYHGESSR
jgi:hypothetical protein